jgi:prolyl-tRNA synthetase
MVYCIACPYAANLEKAEIPRPEAVKPDPFTFLPVKEVHTPNVRTIEEVCAFLSCKPGDVVKTLLFSCDGKPVAVLIQGEEEINEIKLKNYLNAGVVELATDDVVLEVTGAPKGFAGALGIKCRIIADYSLINMKNFVMGANREDYHLKNCNFGRDFKVEAFADLRMIQEGDTCPRCGKDIRFARASRWDTSSNWNEIQQGHEGHLPGPDGKEKLMIMGCYGIGIGRTAAACIEQNHDEEGIVWPVPLAPFHVVVTPVNINDGRLMEAGERLYRELTEAGLEVLFDDRDERAGVKFKDADLIGIPWRVTLGPKRIEEERARSATGRRRRWKRCPWTGLRPS